MKKLGLVLTLFLLCLPLVSGAQAQTGARISLRLLQSEQFPEITGFFDLRDAEGNLVTGLELEDVTALEDGAPVPLSQLRMAEPGLRVAVAINPSDTASIRNAEGVSRYELITEPVLAWVAPQQDESGTQLSLITNQAVLSGFATPEEWLTAFESYQPDFAAFSPALQPLASALQLATSPADQPGEGSAIWLISATPSADVIGELQALQDSALEAGVPIIVWLVDAPSRFNSEEAQAMQTLATSTGGAYFTFSGAEEIPDPAQYFDSLGSAYFFQYSSQIRSAGEHEVVLQVALGEETLSTNPRTFTLDLQPPNPILVSPPGQIERAPSEEDPSQLAPFSRPLEIIVEFPDGFEREVVSSALFVDGEQMAVNSSAPFNRFNWDLEGYESSQRVFLRVEVEDELGLMGSSVEVPVEISVVQASSSWRVFLSQNAGVLTVSAAILAAGALFLVLIVSGRLSPDLLRRRAGSPPSAPEEIDPLLQSPLPPMKEEVNIPSGLEAAEEEGMVEQAPVVIEEPTSAYLRPIAPDQASLTDELLALKGAEIRIGSEENLSDLVLEHSSIEEMHSTIRRGEDGSFTIADQGTEAGTWINYAPVSREGGQVHDGDLLHIGRVAFRFILPSVPDSTRDIET